MPDHEDLVPAKLVGPGLLADYGEIGEYSYLRLLRLIADGKVPAVRRGKWVNIERQHMPLVATAFGITPKTSDNAA